MVDEAAVCTSDVEREMKDEKSYWGESEDLKCAPASVRRESAIGAGAGALRRKQNGCNYLQMAARIAPTAPHMAITPTTVHSKSDPHVVHAPPCSRELS